MGRPQALVGTAKRPLNRGASYAGARRPAPIYVSLPCNKTGRPLCAGGLLDASQYMGIYITVSVWRNRYSNKWATVFQLLVTSPPLTLIKNLAPCYCCHSCWILIGADRAPCTLTLWRHGGVRAGQFQPGACTPGHQGLQHR